jgi:hypothetical protein
MHKTLRRAGKEVEEGSEKEKEKEKEERQEGQEVNCLARETLSRDF